MWRLLTTGLSRYLLYAIGVLLLALGSLGWLYRQEVQATGALKERTEAQQLVHESRERLLQEQLAAEAEKLRVLDEWTHKTERVLAERERERIRLRAETAELKQRIEALKRSQPDVADWMDQPVPHLLFDELCQATQNHRPAAP